MKREEALKKIDENLYKIEPFKKFRVKKLSLIIGVPSVYFAVHPSFTKVPIGNVYYYYYNGLDRNVKI